MQVLLTLINQALPIDPQKPNAEQNGVSNGRQLDDIRDNNTQSTKVLGQLIIRGSTSRG
ncbi:MAG: hypothetical protein R2932_03530 [Caldilineaceae bacterium]